MKNYLRVFFTVLLFSVTACSEQEENIPVTESLETSSKDIFGSKNGTTTIHKEADASYLKSLPPGFAFDVGVATHPIFDTFDDEVCLPPNTGYYFKLLNSSYTGFLEVRAKTPYTNGQWQVSKWFWVENGELIATDEDMEGLSYGNYYAQFRIWTSHPNNLEWSNIIKVEIRHPIFLPCN